MTELPERQQGAFQWVVLVASILPVLEIWKGKRERKNRDRKLEDNKEVEGIDREKEGRGKVEREKKDIQEERGTARKKEIDG